MYKIDILNQICEGSFFYNIDAYNAICVQQGGTGGHKYDIDALNELCGLVGAATGWKYDIDALNAIVIKLGGTASIYEDDALVQVASLLNPFQPVIPAGTIQFEGKTEYIQFENTTEYIQFEEEL